MSLAIPKGISLKVLDDLIFYLRCIFNTHLQNSDTVNNTSFELGFDFTISLLTAELSMPIL